MKTTLSRIEEEVDRILCNLYAGGRANRVGVVKKAKKETLSLFRHQILDLIKGIKAEVIGENEDDYIPEDMNHVSFAKVVRNQLRQEQRAIIDKMLKEGEK